MNAHDQSWRQINRNLRDRVWIVQITPFIEGVAMAMGLLMVMGLLELIGG